MLTPIFVSVHMGVWLKLHSDIVIKVDILATTRSYAKKLEHTKFMSCIDAANIAEQV